jgi:Tfp pilus assembly protein PilF
MNRLELLKQFCADDPADPFNQYALAMEYMNTDTQQAAEILEKLLSEHPDYLPSYYLAAKLHEALGNKEKAIAIYERGIVVAQTQQSTKTLRELQSAYNELMFEY